MGGPAGDGWVFPQGPATHAFVAYRELPGPAHRVDAVIPRVEDTLWARPIIPTVIWELLPQEGVQPEEGLREALHQRGTPYDVPELCLEALAVLAHPVLAPYLPWSAMTGLVICSSSVCEVMRASRGPASKLGLSILKNDHYPEEVGQGLRGAEGAPWLRRGVLGDLEWP